MSSPNASVPCSPCWEAALALLHSWPTALGQPPDAEAGLAALQACLIAEHDEDDEDTRFVCQWQRPHPQASLRPHQLLLVRTDEQSATLWYAALPWPSDCTKDLDDDAIGLVAFYLAVVNAQVLWTVRRQGLWQVLPPSVWHGSQHVEMGSGPAPTWEAIGYHDPILAWDDAGYPMGETFMPIFAVPTPWERAHRLHQEVLATLLEQQMALEPPWDDTDENWEEHDQRFIFTFDRVARVTQQLGFTSPFAAPSRHRVASSDRPL